MKAGAELDMLIATKIMNETVSDGWVMDKAGQRLRPVEPYSDNIGAAWEVVEKLSDDNFSLEQNGTHWKARFGTHWRGALTAPLAICLAALEAVG